MNSLPTYSVVIPAYNAEKSIEKTLDSILAQTVLPEEIIVVDDGSTDDTCKLVGRYGDSVTLLQQKNSGPAVARNKGIRHSMNQWVALLDADDSWLPNKLEVQLPECVEDVGIIHCSELQEEWKIGPNGLDFDTLWNHNYIGTSTVVLNKEAFNKVGGFGEDPRLICIEDFNLWLRIVALGYRVVSISQPLVDYTPAEGNLSSNYERVIKAEIYNAEVLGQELNLPKEMIRRKKSALYEEYAKALFWKRNIPLARHYYGQLLKQRLSLKGLGFWLATFLPPALLNARRPSPA